MTRPGGPVPRGRPVMLEPGETITVPPAAARRRRARGLWVAAYLVAILCAANVALVIGDWLRHQPHDIPALWAAVFATQAALLAGWAMDAQRAERP